MRKARTVAAIACLIAVASCATLDVDAYRTLGSIQVAVDTGMKIYASQVVAGRVSESVQATVKVDYQKYQLAFATAGAAIQAWKAAGGPFPSEKVTAVKITASVLPNVDVSQVK